MDALGAQIQSNYMDAIPGFRRTHVIAILINIAQLVAIVWCLIAVGSEPEPEPARRGRGGAGRSR